MKIQDEYKQYFIGGFLFCHLFSAPPESYHIVDVDKRPKASYVNWLYVKCKHWKKKLLPISKTLKVIKTLYTTTTTIQSLKIWNVQCDQKLKKEYKTKASLVINLYLIEIKF